jgi:putative transposase
MTRPLRICYEGAFYHVMNRGRNKAAIFLSSHDFNSFLILLRQACERFNVKVLAYCLMSNHYHLLIHTPEANLSRFMRHVDGVSTQRYNRQYKKDGSLFKGRFKSILVEEEDYLIRLIRYIHLNPFKAKMNTDPHKYAWSSHQYYLSGKDEGEWLTAQYGLNLISHDQRDAMIGYKELMQEGIDQEIQKFYSKKNLFPILGSEAFISKIKMQFVKGDPKKTIQIPQKREMLKEKMIKRIFQTVSNQYAVLEDQFYVSQRGKRNLPRQIAITLSRDLSGLTHREIAMMFKMPSERSVNKTAERLTNRLKKDPPLHRQYRVIKSKCRQVET